MKCNGHEVGMGSRVMGSRRWNTGRRCGSRMKCDGDEVWMGMPPLEYRKKVRLADDV